MRRTDTEAILGEYYDPGVIPPADRHHMLRRAIKEAQARIAKRVGMNVHAQQHRARGVA